MDESIMETIARAEFAANMIRGPGDDRTAAWRGQKDVDAILAVCATLRTALDTGARQSETIATLMRERDMQWTGAVSAEPHAVDDASTVLVYVVDSEGTVRGFRCTPQGGNVWHVHGGGGASMWRALSARLAAAFHASWREIDAVEFFLSGETPRYSLAAQLAAAQRFTQCARAASR